MRVTPLEAPFGARLELGTDAPLDAADRVAFRRALHRHGLLIVRGTPIDDPRQIELMSLLGRVEPDESGAPMRMVPETSSRFCKSWAAL